MRVFGPRRRDVRDDRKQAPSPFGLPRGRPRPRPRRSGAPERRRGRIRSSIPRSCSLSRRSACRKRPPRSNSAGDSTQRIRTGSRRGSSVLADMARDTRRPDEGLCGAPASRRARRRELGRPDPCLARAPGGIAAAFDRGRGRGWPISSAKCRERRALEPFAAIEGATIPGFRVARSDPPREIALEGQHRFSRYRLTFEIAARIRLAHPGGDPRGVSRCSRAFYRALVVGSGGPESSPEGF